MLKRKLSSYLAEFYSKQMSSALLVTGARQTGKTFAIREFGRSRFKHFVEINFIENPDAVESFNSARNAEELLLVSTTPRS